MKNSKLSSCLYLIVLFIHSSSSHAQVCATPTKNGTNNSLNGTVNSYWTPSNGTYNGSSTAITIGSRTGAAVNIASGDLVLVIQIQCANINTNDGADYGDGNLTDTEFGSVLARGYTDPVSSCLAGRYEYLRAGPATSSSSLDLSQNPLTNTYIQAGITNTTGRRTFQVIRVPQYDSATLNGTVTAPVWNGFTGGIVALDVANQLDFNGNTINVDGLGFRGGGGRARSTNNAVIRYRSRADTRHASKGEGIVSTPRWVSNNRSPTSSATTSIVDLNLTSTMGYPSGTATPGDFARGAPGNAGGGGTFWDGASDNGGGGAAGNGGAGGRGGAGWRLAGYSGININYSNLTEKKWGFGGSAFSSSISRVVFGGGGGAGDNNNNSTPEQSSGAAGGGIVLIRAREILGTGTIFARGARASNNSLNDGAGAGGAGGSVIVVSSDMSTSNLTINAAGGRGGDTWLTGGYAHGTGGGGGGGVVYRTGPATVIVTGGTNGLTNTADSPPDGANHGAKPGSSGINQVITVPSDSPGINTGFRCLDFGDAPSSYLLARHNLNINPSNLRIGSLSPDGDATIHTGIPSANANFDDLSANDDEDGVTLPSVSTLSGIYTATVVVRNNSGSNANLCGWMDFDQDGIFQSDEGVCQVISSMASNQNINMAFTVPVADRTNSGQIFGRFRLTTNALTTSNPTGVVEDGEVEDHSVLVSSLPVSIYKFNSQLDNQQLKINWGTASETNNAGFNIWGINEKRTFKLNKQLIPTKNTGVLKSIEYTENFRIADINIDEIALSAVDIRGKEDIFGYFKIGKKIGRDHTASSIDWDSINSKNSNTILNNNLINKQHLSNKSNQSMRVLVTPIDSGMQQITYEGLLSEGIDLAGIRNDTIAVSINSQPVARFIGQNNQYSDVIFASSYEIDSSGIFGPHQKIEFWAQSPDFPDAEYLDFYTYEISVSPELVKKHQNSAINAANTISTYTHNSVDNQNNEYGFIVPSPDPWFSKRLMNFSTEDAKQYSVNFEVDAEYVGNAGSIKVLVSGGTDLPDTNPDHELSIFINDQLINTTQFEGVTEKLITTSIPQNVLQTGSNTVTLRLTDGTGAQFDIINIDSVTLSYSRNLSAIDEVLKIDDINTHDSLLVNKSTNNLDTFYSANDKDLFILESRNHSTESLLIANNDLGNGSYWISSNQKLNKPNIEGVVNSQDLIQSNIDYLIIAHPAFMPAIGDNNHVLNQYINTRTQEGWNINLVSIEDIQNKYSGGMKLPNAVTKFLQDYQISSNIKHVLLVGNDTYDYKNNLGLNSTSYIPTTYKPTLFIPHTPSDAMLTDIDEDGVPNISIGRWPVRTLNELEIIVSKTLNWSTSNDLTAIYITDVEESESISFESQAGRLIDTIVNSNINNIEIKKIFPSHIILNEGENIVDKSRELMFDEWENKHSLTNFIGHGSPSQWSKQGILATEDLESLNNHNHPTLIGTLTCYSSYFVSPETNSLSLALMNGSNGTPNGAVAIHGAVSLSSYSGNEIFVNYVLELQLQGKTLGDAIMSARLLSKSLNYNDQVINWTLLGDPTLRLNLD